MMIFRCCAIRIGGWGRLLDMGFDIIQTDWPGPLREYIVTRGYHLYAEHKI